MINANSVGFGPLGELLGDWTTVGYQGFAAYPRLTEVAIQFAGLGSGTSQGTNGMISNGTATGRDRRMI
ncbi:hypothetical protein B4Q13_20645 [Lacticaseibacillus rhamnosus]